MTKHACPCCSQLNYDDCCRTYIEEQDYPTQPQALMRSRYTAFTQANMPYIIKTMRGKAAMDFNVEESTEWSRQIKWLGLKIVSADEVDLSMPTGFVEFIASFKDQGQLRKLHERSEFQRIDGRWYYVASHPPLMIKNISKANSSRNGLCPCGSLRKYKNCHGKT